MQYNTTYIPYSINGAGGGGTLYLNVSRTWIGHDPA
jgi:hypothetical protein